MESNVIHLEGNISWLSQKCNGGEITMLSGIMFNHAGHQPNVLLESIKW